MVIQIPVFFAALQGSVRLDRDASGAVRALDPRSVAAGPDQHLQPVRSHPLQPDDGAGASGISWRSASCRVIMGFSMFLQMKMNPEPTDPVQKAMFSWMPVIFTFMLGTFPSGLVVYWTVNNTLTIIQQSVIMKRAGVKLELFGNLSRHVRWQGGGKSRTRRPRSRSASAI